MSDLAGFKISGRCFPKDTKLTFFPKPTDRLACVFGRNGAGKSTLSNALHELSRGATLPGVELEFLGDGDTPLEDQPSQARRSRVFSERFIDENVRIEGDGLGAIVMLGDAGELKDLIDEKTEVRDGLASEIEELGSALRKYDNPSEPSSPGHYREKIRGCLKRTHGCADRSGKIRRMKQNSPVNERIIETITGLPLPSEDGSSLLKTFEDDLEAYLDLEDSEPEMQRAPKIPDGLGSFRDERAADLLLEKLEEPALTPRDRRIIDVLNGRGRSFIDDIGRTMGDDASDFCPYCFRDLAADERASIMSGIEQVLNEDAERHTKALQDMEKGLEPMTIDWRPYEKLPGGIAGRCRQQMEACNEVISEYRGLFLRKIASPFQPIEGPESSVAESIADLSGLLDELAVSIAGHDAAVESRSRTKQDLQDLNSRLARIDIDSDYKEYSKRSTEREEVREKLRLKNEAFEEVENVLGGLSLRMRNEHIALGLMNKGLSFIFLGSRRLKLKGRDGIYELYSNGARVKPSDVSSGERNAMALCYYFTSLCEGKAIDLAHSDPMLLVIDDPVSSLDFENRIGIFSYLKSQLREALVGNGHTKVLLLTHDGMAMDAFQVLGREMERKAGRSGGCSAGLARLRKITPTGLQEWGGAPRAATRRRSGGCTSTAESPLPRSANTPATRREGSLRRSRHSNTRRAWMPSQRIPSYAT